MSDPQSGAVKTENKDQAHTIGRECTMKTLTCNGPAARTEQTGPPDQ